VFHKWLNRILVESLRGESPIDFVALMAQLNPRPFKT
jgi:hypothetical protein